MRVFLARLDDDASTVLATSTPTRRFASTSPQGGGGALAPGSPTSRLVILGQATRSGARPEGPGLNGSEVGSSAEQEPFARRPVLRRHSGMDARLKAGHDEQQRRRPSLPGLGSGTGRPAPGCQMADSGGWRNVRQSFVNPNDV